MRPSFENYFLEIAKLVATRSTCLRRSYGAVVVKDNVIVSTGYNGSSRGEANCCDVGECYRQKMGIPHGQMYERCLAVHAEQNAVINGDPSKMAGGTIYIAGYYTETGEIADGHPCLMCDRVIKNARISEVVYLSEDGTVQKYSPQQKGE